MSGPALLDAAARAEAALAALDGLLARLPDGPLALPGARVLLLDVPVLLPVLLAAHGAQVEAPGAPWPEPEALRALRTALARGRRELSPRPLDELLAGAAPAVALAAPSEGPRELAVAGAPAPSAAALHERAAALLPRLVAGGALLLRARGAALEDLPEAGRPRRHRPASAEEALRALGSDVVEAGPMDADGAAWLRLRRATAPCSEYPVETDHGQTLAHSRARYGLAAGLAPGRRVLDLGCGAGLGARQLLAAGAADLVGLDAREEALSLARAADPGAPEGRWRRHDLDQPLPFSDGAFGLVVALEVLEHVTRPRALLDEVRRVLAPDGAAVLSVPHRASEDFWAEAAGTANPYHLAVPDRAEFEAWLAGFADVRLHVQADLAVSLVRPLAAAQGPPAEAPALLPVALPLADASVTLLAVCRPGPGPSGAPPPPPACAHVDHQERFASSVAHGRRLEADLRRARWERLAADNRRAWDRG